MKTSSKSQDRKEQSLSVVKQYCWGVDIEDVVAEAIKYHGERTSLEHLQNVVCELSYFRKRKFLLQCIENCKNFVKKQCSDANWLVKSNVKSIKDYTTQLFKLDVDYDSDNFPKLPKNELSRLRRKLGSTYDCRTHRDVPNRNMIKDRCGVVAI